MGRCPAKAGHRGAGRRCPGLDAAGRAGTPTRASSHQWTGASYFEADGCTFRRYEINAKGVSSRTRNYWPFTARITEVIERHEAGLITRLYRIRATQPDGKTAEATIEAKDFEAMGWVQDQLGPTWVIEAGRGIKDHLRVAIQVFSTADGIGRSVVHTATGWMEHNGQWLYLHAGGAIGPDGPTEALRIEPGNALAAYRLPDPPTDPARIAEAVQGCLDLLKLGDAQRPGSQGVAAVLATLPIRAVLGVSDFTVQFSGPTGTLKSSAARLALDHVAYHMGGSRHQCRSRGPLP